MGHSPRAAPGAPKVAWHGVHFWTTIVALDLRRLAGLLLAPGEPTHHSTSMMTWTRRECLGLKMFMRMMSEYRRDWRPDNNREACVGWTSVLLYSILGRWIYLWMMLSRLTSQATAVAAVVAAAAAPCEAEVAEIAASAQTIHAHAHICT